MIARNDQVQPPASATEDLKTLALLLVAIAVGTIGALLVLPGWLPGLIESLASATPTASWYLIRSTGFVAFGLLWLSMAMGLLITNKIGRVWPGGASTFELHQFVSILGLAFGFIHPLIMLGDNYSMAQIFVPFAGVGYRVIPVSLGQIALILLAIIVPSYAVRWITGHRTWRILHYVTFLVFVMALAHGIFSGTDSATPLVTAMYWASSGSLIVLTVYRIKVTRSAKQRAAMVYAGVQKESSQIVQQKIAQRDMSRSVGTQTHH